jgi:PmbA protein
VDLEQTTKRLLGLIEDSGADQGEVYMMASSGLTMEVRDQAVERLKKEESSGYGLRLISGGRMAVVASSDLREPSLEKTVAKGLALAKTAAPDEDNVLAEPSAGGAGTGAYDQTFDDVSVDRKTALLKDLETLVFAYDPAIRRIEGLAYSDSKVDVLVANTNGVFRRRRGTRFEVSCSVIAERDGDVSVGSDESSASIFDRLDAPSKLATRACWQAISVLGGKSVPSQSAPVIFDKNVGTALLVHLIAMANGENVTTGMSALKGRIGEAIGSGLVTVVDDPTLPGGVSSAPFDDEGTPCAKTVVLDQGVLKTFLFDARTARKFGARSTGNGWRRGYRDVPSVGTSNLYLEKGDRKPEEIIKSTARGLWVTGLTGWWMGISPATGDFSSGARGLWIENGEVVHAVKGVTVASNALEMLRGVNAVGDDLSFKQRTVCPTLRIAEMSIGGS